MKPLVEVLLSTTAYFKSRGIPSARLDAELLIGHALGLDRVQVYLAHDRPLLEAELEPLRVLVRRRGWWQGVTRLFAGGALDVLESEADAR